MNRFYSFIIALAFTSSAFGQCVADFDFGDVGFGVSPDPALNETFVPGVVNHEYYDVIDILIPTLASDVDEAYPPTLPIDSIELMSVVLTDTLTLMEYSPEDLGLEVVCNNNGDSPEPCMFMGGLQYCASIQGTPNLAGIYRINLLIDGWLTIYEPFSAAFEFDGFILNIQCDLLESMEITHADSDLGTLGSIDVTLNDGIVPTSFSWTDADGNVVGTDEDLIDVSTGSYTLTVDADGCISVYEDNEIVDSAINCTLEADYVVTDEIFDGSLGSIDVTVSGADGLATFVWTDVNGLIIGTDEDLVDVAGGEYSLMITDEAGCELELTGILIDSVVKIESINASTKWSIIPNPTSSSFSIQSD